MTAALALIALAALAALALGLVARAGRDMDLEQWAVGGRGFGWILVFLLLAGEISTPFTFLGASGSSYGLGAPVYYILAYGSLAYVIAYFLLPLVWSYGSQHGLHSQPDFFVRKDFRDPRLGLYCGGQGHPDPWRGALPRHLSAAPSLWRHRPDVRADRRRHARLPCLPGKRAERRMVHLHRALDRCRLLHVAAILRRRLLGEGRARLPTQCDCPADLPAYIAVRVLRRLRRGAASARTEGG